MFGNLKNLASMLGQAKELRAKLEEMQEALERRTVEADAGGGAVRVVVNGKMQVKSVHIDRPMLTALVGEGGEADQQMVEDLIAAAVNAGLSRAKELVQDEAAKITGGMPLPGMEKLLGE